MLCLLLLILDDHSRVKLNGQYDYINANFIEVKFIYILPLITLPTSVQVIAVTRGILANENLFFKWRILFKNVMAKTVGYMTYIRNV